MNMFGYNEKHEKKNKLRLPLSAYLSYLLIATLFVTGISFAKYATTGGTDDGARVALVMVDGGSNDVNTDLSLGDGETSSQYSFYITNNNGNSQISEVPLAYTISVTIPGGENLPEGVAVSLTCSYDVYDNDGAWVETVTSDCYSVSSEHGVYTFDGGADFAAGERGYHNYILTFTMTDESLVTEDSIITGIEISVKAEQID